MDGQPFEGQMTIVDARAGDARAMTEAGLAEAQSETDAVIDLSAVDASVIDGRTARIVGGLALLYHRHDDAARALALGLAAMRLAPPEARLVLLVAAAFLKVGDADQALAALGRLDGPAGPLLAAAASPSEAGAAGVLRAKALFRRGEVEAARAALDQGRALLAAAGDAVPEGAR